MTPNALRWITGVFCLWFGLSYADERLWVPAKINGNAARLGFDTGASEVILWRAGALRLGLKFTAPQTNATLAIGEVPFGLTEECTLRVWGMKVKTQFCVVDLPEFLHPTNFDGLIGWRPISRNIVQIDAEAQKVTFLSGLPKRISNWTALPLNQTASILELELIQTDKKPQMLVVDTGDDRGVALPAEKWSDWKMARPLETRTLNAFFMPGSDIMVAEEAWADKILVGSLVLTGVPISEASRTQGALGSPKLIAVLGLAALRRLDFIVDGRHGMAYLRPKTSPAPAYEHNRAGAVFVPEKPKGEHLVARVLEPSPAYEAGLRNGDVLLSVDEVDFSHMRPGADIHPNQAFHEHPAGTKLTLVVKRGDRTMKLTVTLRQILGPVESKSLHEKSFN